MVVIKGSFIILLFLFLGETVSYFIGGFIPGSVVGMLLMFASLSLKIVKVESVKVVADFLTKNMAMFFIPASIGIMEAWRALSDNLTFFLIVSFITTFLIIAVVSLIQEFFEKRRR